MKEKLKLIQPSNKYADQIQKYKDEMLEFNSTMDGCGTLRRDSIAEWLKKCKDYKAGRNLPPSFCVSTQYICIRESDDKLIGMLQIRHELSDFLFNYGGHIGDSILPSERNKGYGKKILELGLKKCKQLGINKVLILCKESNAASRKCIISNGGVYEDTRTREDGTRLERYWITLD